MKMTNKNSIKLFEDSKIRAIWDENKEDWYFSIIDVISVLTESKNPKTYWKVLKHRLKEDGNQTVTNCNRLKMLAGDGKMRLTDVASTKELLRLIQSIPSPKAEPFKLWLANIGSDRLDEIANPELAMERAVSTYRSKGYSEKWIQQRLKSIEVRNDLTTEWKRSGVNEGLEYAILTDEITKAWAEISTKDYKKLKNLKKENLKDNMTNLELVLAMVAEVSTTETLQNL
ncbi:MAG: BRO-N domain-containing protein [Methanobacteriaceae archaeon]